MSWHYQAKKIIVDEEEQYILVEAYPTLKQEGDTIVPHTAEPAAIYANSKEDLAKWLRLAADDVDRFEVIE